MYLVISFSTDSVKIVSYIFCFALLTLKAQVTTASDDSIVVVFFFNFSEKLRLLISCELSATDSSHEISSQKNRKKINLKMTSATILYGAFSVNWPVSIQHS